jgi:amidase
MALAEYAHYDALGLAELVAKKQVTPLELAEEAIARIEKHNPTLNAVVRPLRLRPRHRRGARRRPVPRRPFSSRISSATSPACRRARRTLPGRSADPQDDTLVVLQGRRPGAARQTNVPEFGLLPTTEGVLYGAAHNPWNLRHSTGGSSGGSAAAVAAGIVPMAHANDGGGSIRIPASCCGLVGLKPSRARNPLGPMLGDIMSGLICEGVVSRTVRDTAAMLDCTAGPEPGDPYMVAPPARPFAEEARTAPGRLRIAFATSNATGAKLHPECVAAVEATARLCEELGHVVVEAAPPVDQNQMTPFLAVWCSGLAMQIEAMAMLTGREIRSADFEGLTWSLYEQGKQVTGAQYLLALAMVQMTGRAVGQFHERYDAWLTPTLGAPPIALGTIDIEQRDVMTAFAPIIDYVLPHCRTPPAGGDLAAAAGRRRSARRRDVQRQARRRGNAPPPCRPARAGAAVEGQAAADLGLRQLLRLLPADCWLLGLVLLPASESWQHALSPQMGNDGDRGDAAAAPPALLRGGGSRQRPRASRAHVG